MGLEDGFFVECTEKYPILAKLDLCKKTHEIFWVRAGMENLGWPGRRYRTYGFALARGKLAWAGPPDYQEDFANRYHRSIRLTGDVFLQSPMLEACEEYSRMASIQKIISVLKSSPVCV